MDQQLLRSLGIEGDLDIDSSTTKGGPGKSTLTSKLTPAPQVVFRVSDPETARALGESFGSGSRPRIQREVDAVAGGRDGNGVMAGAEAAVDRAAASSGAALPAHIQRQFEGSLGADLSSVRVHTGSDSQEAAHAVGAKAYTVGNDIHFAAGKYQPDDPFGMHLLAHEVAHTVQQSGGAQRRQHKLEVSTPHDAAEHEADRAADAMVRGEAATVSGASGVARKIETRSDIERAGDSGAADPMSQGGLGYSCAGEIKVEGKDSAAALKTEIASWQGRLGQNAGMEDKVAANTRAMGQLDNVASASDCVGFAVNGFTGLFASTQAEYGRLMAMASSPAFAGLGFGAPDAKSGDAAAEDHAKRADGGTSSTTELAQRAEKIADTSGPNGGENKVLKSSLDEVKNSEKEAQAAATDVADKQTLATASMTGLTGAKQTLAGVQAAAQAKSIKDAYEKVKAEYEKAKKALEDSFGFIEKLKDVGEGAIEGKAPAGPVWDVFKEIATLAIVGEAPKTDDQEKQAARKQEEADVAAFNGALNTFNAEGKKVAGTIKAFSEAIGRLQRAKAEHRRKVKELGQKFDAADPAQKGKKRKAGETGTFETIAVFQGQADAFLVTAAATREVGERDLTRGGTGAGGSVAPTESAAKSAANAVKGAEAMTAYKIEDRMTEVSDTDPNESGASGGPGTPGKTHWALRAHLVDVPISIMSDLRDDETTMLDPTQHEGLEGRVHKALAELDGYVTQIKAYKTKLGGVMGL